MLTIEFIPKDKDGAMAVEKLPISDTCTFADVFAASKFGDRHCKPFVDGEEANSDTLVRPESIIMLMEK